MVNGRKIPWRIFFLSTDALKSKFLLTVSLQMFAQQKENSNFRKKYFESIKICKLPKILIFLLFYVKSVCYYTKKFSKVTFTLAKEFPCKRSKSVSRLLEALVHLISKLHKIQQKARDTDKVWKKSLQKDFGAPLKKYSKSNEICVTEISTSRGE